MIDYQKLKEKVSVRDYAESIGYEISGNGMIRCPFHNDRTPSMKIDESHYHCFGCGAHGDVIGFVAELYGISNSAAAKRIMDEFGLDSDDYSRSDNPPPAKKKESLREWRNNTVAYYIYLEKAMKKCIKKYEKEYKEYASEVKIYADSFDALKKENKKLQNDSKISMETRLQMGKQRMEYEEALKVLANIPEDVIRRYNYKSEQIHSLPDRSR